MTVSLQRAYGGFPVGAIVTFPAELEASLISQSIASNTASIPNSGAQSNTFGNDFALIGISGVAVVATGAASVVVSNPRITAQSKAFAVVSQAAADGTFTNVIRCSTAAGALTITGPATATAPTQVSYLILA